MDEKVKLVYEVKGRTITIEEGTMEEIDFLTKKFENESELEIFYRKKIKKINIEEKQGYFFIINEEKRKIKVIYKNYNELFYMLINDEKFLVFLDKNYKKYQLNFPDTEKYPLYSNEIKKKTIDIYRREYKGKIDEYEKEDEFIGSLLENSKVKKLGGI
jgi:hypothetical protein